MIKASDGFGIALDKGDNHLAGFPARSCGLGSSAASRLDLIADARDDQGLEGQGGWLTHAAPFAFARLGQVDGRKDQGVGYTAISSVAGRAGEGDIMMGICAMTGIAITAQYGIHHRL